MKTNADYKPILESLKTLKESGKVIIRWEDGHFGEEEKSRPHVELFKDKCNIHLRIYRTDTLESLGEKVIKAEELMDELEMHIVYKKQNPEMYDFLYANLEL